MSKARQRQRKRRQRQESLSRQSQRVQQIGTERGIKIPEFHLPGARYFVLVPLGVALIALVIFILGSINPPEPTTFPNAVWLDQRWTYSPPPQEAFDAQAQLLRDNRIGTVYAYVSSLKPDDTWIGLTEDSNFTTEARANVRTFVEQFREAYPDGELYGWIEVLATTAEGYRLDSQQLQRTVADFSGTIINDLGFDGIFLDVKPIFDGNDDYLELLRTIRQSVGLEAIIAVSVPPDLTPTDVDFEIPDDIAPGTVWSDEYKQRVALQADQIVITAYNSYIDNPVDYIDWVTYQVTSFATALTDLGIETAIYVSVPNYPEALPAHLASVESLSGALDGVSRALPILGEDQRTVVNGVAVYNGSDMNTDDWRTFREKWLN